MAWDESKHPRVPAGSSEGGQFTDKVVAAARAGAGLPPEKYFYWDLNPGSVRAWGIDESGELHKQPATDKHVQTHYGLAQKAGLGSESDFIVRGITGYLMSSIQDRKILVFYDMDWTDSRLEFWDRIGQIFDRLSLPGNTPIYSSWDGGHHGELERRTR